MISPGYPFNIRSKGQRSRSWCYTSAKNISSDRVACVSLHSIEWPSSLVFLNFVRPNSQEAVIAAHPPYVRHAAALVSIPLLSWHERRARSPRRVKARPSMSCCCLTHSVAWCCRHRVISASCSHLSMRLRRSCWSQSQRLSTARTPRTNCKQRTPNINVIIGGYRQCPEPSFAQGMSRNGRTHEI